MNKLLICLCMFLFLSVAVVAKGPDSKINIMSFNIRYDNAGDGDNQWKFRKDYAADLIRFYDADIIGTQEVLHNQLTDLCDRMPDYSYVGVGREDGKTKGEYSVVLFKKDRFKIIDSGNFWLSENMNAIGNKGWDAACERIATWVILKDKESGKSLFLLNTHLDHMGQTARREGAKLVLKEAEVLAKGLPVVVTGDFNATPNEESIQVLTNKNDKRYLTHTRDIAALKYGPEYTFHNFGKIPVEKRQFIDYIFVKGDIKVTRHGVLTDLKYNLYPSDHYPILATIIME